MTIAASLQSDKHALIQAAVTRLNSQLPLKARQDALLPRWKSLHQQILRFLATQGRPPDSNALRKMVDLQDLHKGLQRLGQDDLVVLASHSEQILGAYPLTSEVTPHKVTLNGHSLYAMCALDAVSVAPMFTTNVRIESICHVSHTPIVIRMHNTKILEIHPGSEVTIGIRWQIPSAVAAHSMCLEMVFLKDRHAAQAWQHGDEENISLFTLPEAALFGKSFFLPLMN